MTTGPVLPWGAGLRQPDRLSCGASVLVVARMLHDPAYRPDFRAEVLRLHRAVVRPVGAGRPQVPWPRALGTPPWAVARELTRSTGRRHRVRRARWDAVVAPCALYVGNRLLPRHVVLVVEVAGDRLRCYDPATGTLREVGRDALERGRLGLAGWDRPWLLVTPPGRPPSRRTAA